MASKLPLAARALLRGHRRRLTLAAQPGLQASATPRASPSLRRPQPLASQLPAEQEAYYAGLLLHAVLNPHDNGQTALSNSSPNNPNMNASAPEPRSPPPERVCDEEWEIRTGRAIYILERTLPDFFETGLVSSLDQATKEPSPSAQKLWSLASPTDTWHTIKEKLSSTSKSKEDCDEVPTIYSSRIRLTYTPPTPLPTPFPKTLRVEGLHLYIASSIFVRHTLNALYTDLVVNITRVRVNNGGVPINGGLISSSSQSKKSREKSITFGLMVTGIGRVSGARAEWEVNCTYTFSPLTGLIIHHSVDSIEPAPHQALFEALGKFGLLDGGMGPKAGGVGS